MCGYYHPTIVATQIHELRLGRGLSTRWISVLQICANVTASVVTVLFGFFELLETSFE